MGKRFKYYWLIFWQMRKMRLLKLLEYRGDFYFWSIISLMWTAFNFFFFSLIARVGGGIAGWSIEEIYVLLSVFTIIDAFTWSLFYHNMHLYTYSVFNGELSQYLTKPIDAQFLLMTQENSYNNILRFITGVGLLFWSLSKLNIEPTLTTWFVFGLVLTAALILIYFFWFMLSTLSFWVDKLDNINEVLPALRRIWQVPSSVFQGRWGIAFVLVFPLVLVSTVPSQVLINKVEPWSLCYLILTSILILGLSRWFFRVSIKRFAGVGN